MPSNRSRERGFSLLELIIVLMVMIGLLAIAWPNLQRPLRRNSLSEAAATLRSAIDDSRYQAITTGTPVFVQLQQGSDSVQSGSFDNFMSNDVNIASTGTSLQPATLTQPGNRSLQATPQSALRTWTLPAPVVISDVRWTLDLPSDELALSDPLTESAAPVAEVQSNTMMSKSVDQAGNIDGGAGQAWWLPLVATGQGRDAAIVLLDTSINQEITVTYASATGALEIVK